MQEHMLNSVHHHLRHQGCEDPCSAPHCITHRKFAMEIVEQYKCPNCLSSSEPFGYNQLVYHVSVSALITQFQQHRLAGKPTTFGQLLCECGSAGQYHICQKVTCQQRYATIQKTLLNLPDVVSIGLIWDTDCAGMEQITELVKMIGTTVRLTEVYSKLALICVCVCVCG
eukprot:m.81974 g.81974  ORF g.81974 m.81974 type:complete len:170 (+) comp36275_c0_seq4:51-560(+)